jgi:hypothetical protein
LAFGARFTKTVDEHGGIDVANKRVWVIYACLAEDDIGRRHN